MHIYVVFKYFLVPQPSLQCGAAARAPERAHAEVRWAIDLDTGGRNGEDRAQRLKAHGVCWPSKTREGRHAKLTGAHLVAWRPRYQ